MSEPVRNTIDVTPSYEETDTSASMFAEDYLRLKRGQRLVIAEELLLQHADLDTRPGDWQIPDTARAMELTILEGRFGGSVTARLGLTTEHEYPDHYHTSTPTIKIWKQQHFADWDPPRTVFTPFGEIRYRSAQLRDLRVVKPGEPWGSDHFDSPRFISPGDTVTKPLSSPKGKLAMEIVDAAVVKILEAGSNPTPEALGKTALIGSIPDQEYPIDEPLALS